MLTVVELQNHVWVFQKDSFSSYTLVQRRSSYMKKSNSWLSELFQVRSTWCGEEGRNAPTPPAKEECHLVPEEVTDISSSSVLARVNTANITKVVTLVVAMYSVFQIYWGPRDPKQQREVHP